MAGIRTNGSLRVELVSEAGETLHSGLEFVAEGLPLDPMPQLEERAANHIMNV